LIHSLQFINLPGVYDTKKWTGKVTGSRLHRNVHT